MVTLVVHFGQGEWDGPLSIHEMLAPCDGRLLALVPDYRINLLSPANMEEGDFARFNTELGLVLGYIKYSDNKNSLRRFVEGDGRFRSVDVESAELINVLTDSRIEIVPGEESVDMCQAIKDIRQEGVDEGMHQGMRQGMLLTLRDLVRDGVLAPSDAAARAGLSVEEFQAKVAAL